MEMPFHGVCENLNETKISEWVSDFYEKEEKELLMSRIDKHHVICSCTDDVTTFIDSTVLIQLTKQVVDSGVWITIVSGLRL